MLGAGGHNIKALSSASDRTHPCFGPRSGVVASISQTVALQEFGQKLAGMSKRLPARVDRR
jgi:hypothetical protein